jgi:flagellar biosynthesis/type III secretory pathway M-ring protein FliF/YscJ
VYGEENFTVAVSTVLDTDHRITQRHEFMPHDPDNPQNNPLNYAEHLRERLGPDGWFVEGVPGATDNTDVPMYQARDLGIGGADAYVARDVFDYLVSSIREDIISEGLTITDVSVAVLINRDGLSNAEHAVLLDSISKASGSDNVSVNAIRFISDPVLPGVEEPMPLLQLFIITGAAFLALLIIFLIMLISTRKKHRAALAAAEAAALEDDGIEYDEYGMPLVDLVDEDEGFEPIIIPETAEAKLKTQIKDLAITDPEIVAQLIKTWLVQT